MPPTKTSDRQCAKLSSCDFFLQFEGCGNTNIRPRVRIADGGTSAHSSKLPRLARRTDCKDLTVCGDSGCNTRLKQRRSRPIASVCASLPACELWQHRGGCGGSSPGKCVFDCVSGNCYVGPAVAGMQTFMHAPRGRGARHTSLRPERINVGEDKSVELHERVARAQSVHWDGGVILVADTELEIN